MLTRLSNRPVVIGAACALIGLALGAGLLFSLGFPGVRADTVPGQPATPVSVSVATVTTQDVVTWDEFSGRLEAVQQVAMRSRVVGTVKSVHFREGALVNQDDLLFTIDPAPYAAEVERAQAQVVGIEARLSFTRIELDRAQRLIGHRAIAQREHDELANAHREAKANLRAAQAVLRSARLSLLWTEVRAPVSGRVGKAEVTVGNLVSAGPDAPVLTTLVSVTPIYASFNADEHTLARTLRDVPPSDGARWQIAQIPVQMRTAGPGATRLQGRLQWIDNQIDTRSGTARMRAVFDNSDGVLTPGQFVRLRLGQASGSPALLISERAIGTDQDKQFVIVVDAQNKTQWRAVTLGASVDGLRVVTSGLQAGERVVVNGVQRVRPGMLVDPQPVALDVPPKSLEGNAASAANAGEST